ncbi:MAG TPA: hypothetical protein DD624_05730 [Alphaproteobacteria bacterium]|nr:hypothetical protein [Alphaproteobacteria bacterium]
MSRFVLIMMFAAMATGMFVIKNRVIGLENELSAVNTQIRADQKAIHVLKAEWTYLNDPQRIRALSERHAAMKPITGERIISFAAIPFKNKQAETGLIRVSYASARE